MAIIGLMLPTSGYTQDYLDQRTALAEARVPAGADIEFQMSVPQARPSSWTAASISDRPSARPAAS